ncbi:ATP-binding protein [Micromonospora haikouensis]|uniref:ATP-binding protein n=1 Tax=Micromonospora TaxID=1873 RepID=UPI001E4D3193|nr:ATP-binding protein [Micromonospora sp. NBRC 110038]
MTLADRLRWARERAFVGRVQELATFRAALRGEPGAPILIYVYGPGGVGKSTLLRRFADEGRDAGRPVTEINGRLIDPSPTGFTAEVREPFGPGSVLVVDAFEHCQGLDEWLRETFLPSLPGDALVVVAGREPPHTSWQLDLAWQQAMVACPLGELTRDEASSLLELRGLAPDVRDRVLDFAGGHPLALNLAASVSTAVGGTVWRPTPDVFAALIGHLVGDVPGPVHRLALEVAAHAMTTTEGLLRAVVGQERAGEMFDWLRRLPVADWGRQGLYLHDLVSDTIDADLRWRDPEGYAEMHRRVGHHLLDQARTAAEPDAMVAIRELSYLKRYGPVGAYFQMRREGDFHEDVLRPGDEAAVVAMADDTEGPESAAIVRHWLRRQPEAFRVYRESATGSPVGFLTSLRLTERPSGDPVAEAAWDHAEQTSPLLPGEHVRLSRYCLYPPEYYQVSTVLHLMQLRICADWIRQPGVAWSFIISPYPEAWAPLMEHLGHHRTVEVGKFSLFSCDWRTTPLSVWFDRTQPGPLFADSAGPANSGPVTLPRAEFDQAVREALRNWHRPDVLAANPLRHSRMVAAAPAPADDPTDALRELITGAVDALRDDPREAKLHSVLATTFFRRVPNQAAAAERLGLPFSTYRRHLDRGQQRLCELLWRREGAEQAEQKVSTR